MKVNKHSSELISRIKTSCDNFLSHQIDIVQLQSEVDAIASNFDGSIDSRLSQEVHNFVEYLEYVRFMVNQDDWYVYVQRKIEFLNKIFDCKNRET